ncbi:MAG: hypothetical protein ABJ056_05725 [Halioglobus sp.]
MLTSLVGRSLCVLATLLMTRAALAQVTAPYVEISPVETTGIDFGSQPLGTTTPAMIQLTIVDFLSGDTSIEFSISVSAGNSVFAVDDNQCANVGGGPGVFSCNVPTTFSPVSEGDSISDITISCSYVNPFGFEPSPSGMGVADCLPIGSVSDATLSAYLSGTGTKTPQTISFPAQSPLFREFFVSSTYPLNPSAVASSGLPVTHTSLTPSTCTVSGVLITMVSAGECRVEASQPGDATYEPAVSLGQSVLQINPPPSGGLPTNPGLQFDPQDTEIFEPSGSFLLSPAASTLQTPVDPQPDILYSSATPSVCSIPLQGSTSVDILGVGTCLIAVESAPNSIYLAGGPIEESIEILPRPQTIIFGSQPDQPFSEGATFPLNPAASANSGLPVMYNSLSPAICAMSGIDVIMVSSGNCLIEAAQPGGDTWNAAPPVSQTIRLVAREPLDPTPVNTLPWQILVLLALLMVAIASPLRHKG